MSRVADTVDRPRRKRVRTGDRHPVSPVSAHTTFFRAEPIQRINMIKQGTLASEANRILSDFCVTGAAAESALKISVSSMDRRTGSRDRLPPAESERVLGAARLVGQLQNIMEEFGNPQVFSATAWLSRWQSERLPALGGVRPPPAGHHGRPEPGLQHPRL